MEPQNVYWVYRNYCVSCDTLFDDLFINILGFSDLS